MVKIRLARGGSKKKPYYRVVVTDVRSPRDGRYIETIGFYNPMTTTNRTHIDAERYQYWLSVGAQPSERVVQLAKNLQTTEPQTTETSDEQDSEAAEQTNAATETVEA